MKLSFIFALCVFVSFRSISAAASSHKKDRKNPKDSQISGGRRIFQAGEDGPKPRSRVDLSPQVDMVEMMKKYRAGEFSKPDSVAETKPIKKKSDEPQDPRKSAKARAWQPPAGTEERAMAINPFTTYLPGPIKSEERTRKYKLYYVAPVSEGEPPPAVTIEIVHQDWTLISGTGNSLMSETPEPVELTIDDPMKNQEFSVPFYRVTNSLWSDRLILKVSGEMKTELGMEPRPDFDIPTETIPDPLDEAVSVFRQKQSKSFCSMNSVNAFIFNEFGNPHWSIGKRGFVQIAQDKVERLEGMGGAMIEVGVSLFYNQETGECEMQLISDVIASLPVRGGWVRMVAEISVNPGDDRIVIRYVSGHDPRGAVNLRRMIARPQQRWIVLELLQETHKHNWMAFGYHYYRKYIRAFICRTPGHFKTFWRDTTLNIWRNLDSQGESQMADRLNELEMIPQLKDCDQLLVLMNI